ncbi:hypothetical protein TRFO_43071 [Tritrichomonas foetus]|uniref:Uncharacterized protein n=1 Tax=Tritrichomonas foetus TaxID=1144522 RepID=A0A1J4KTD8_9EUKA|nr:hypothetical protein TRFO_43071 [Tritrichomonas foetus]|eukprot:OHT14394.1 hypothetical protein TRFO_43071 [Tritrichomonas foetus]
MWEYNHYAPKVESKVIRALTPQQVKAFRDVFKFSRHDVHHMKGELNSWLKAFPQFFSMDAKAIYDMMAIKRGSFTYINEHPLFGGDMTDEWNDWVEPS